MVGAGLMNVRRGVWLVVVGLMTTNPIGDAGAESSRRRSPARAVMEPVSLMDVQWTGGFWERKTNSVVERMIPAMWEIMSGTEYKPFLEHFKIAAGTAEGRHRGAKWNDGDFYKWMEAVAASLSLDPDPEWEQILDEAIEVVGAAQRDDGYLHTPTLIAERQGGEGAQPLSDRFDFEMYNHGHLMTAGAVHYEVTGKSSLLTLALRAAGYVESVFADPSEDVMRHAVCPSHYMGLIDLYRVTGEARYLNLAEKLIRMRDRVVGGGDDNQDRLRFVEQGEAVGHAVRANYLYAGVADLVLERQDLDYSKALARLWENVTRKKMYITGAFGALYDGASPDGARNQSVITRVHQAYGRNYQLPNETAHGETCANIGGALWNWRMALATGESRHIDALELSLYNAILSGVSLDGRDYFYTNPLRVWTEPSLELRWSRTRVPFVTSYCCPPNVVRTLASAHGWVYGRSENAIWVNLYGSSRVSTALGNGDRVRLEQTTEYPWDGEVTLRVVEAPEGVFGIRLRIPGWARGASVSVNGSRSEAQPIAGRYLEISRVWTVGDRVALSLPMPAVWMESHPLAEETWNQVALKRGPLVYCLESVDLPKGVGLEDVRVDTAASIDADWRPGLLEGVTVLRGRIGIRKAEPWGQELYRARTEAPLVPTQVAFVPYFSWANRGDGEMSVWLPVD